jgi:hypothetical protein
MIASCRGVLWVSIESVTRALVWLALNLLSPLEPLRGPCSSAYFYHVFLTGSPPLKGCLTFHVQLIGNLTNLGHQAPYSLRSKLVMSIGSPLVLRVELTASRIPLPMSKTDKEEAVTTVIRCPPSCRCRHLLPYLLSAIAIFNNSMSSTLIPLANDPVRSAFVRRNGLAVARVVFVTEYRTVA